MTLQAHAKINVGLHILGKREDGYHDLETVFHEISLSDEISIELSESLHLVTDTPALSAPEENLCLKAARLLQAETAVHKGATIVLKKRIPIGAGLGGGSSDAATVLVGLNTLWDLRLSNSLLCTYASRLGSDVPFFIRGGSAFARGRGEVLDHFRLEIPFWIVVVTPPIHVSTAWAYKNIKTFHRGASSDLKDLVLRALREPAALQSKIRNDFEPLVFEHFPEIQSSREKLLDTGALFALLSGSGSSLFAFFKEETRARSAASLFSTPYSVFLTSPNYSVHNE